MIRIGTRGSSLALWQANWVAGQISAHHPSESTQLCVITTSGDRFQGQFSGQTPGKGLFVKEIEEAILRQEIDLAVHSMKDVPTELPADLAIRVVPSREDPRDALVARKTDMTIEKLPRGARIGTGSPRRSAQLKHFRPDMEIVPLRGNIETRLRKLDDEQLDAIVLALAGLRRLDLEGRVSEIIPTEVILPAVGQGALGLELLKDDAATFAATQFLHDPEASACVECERAFLHGLGGGCQLPIAAYAVVRDGCLQLQGCVLHAGGQQRIDGTRSGSLLQPGMIGQSLAEELLGRGAAKLLFGSC